MSIKKNLSISLILMISLSLLSCKSAKQNNNQGKVLEFEMEYQGHQRSYLVHVPTHDKLQKPAPLLFLIHGGGGTAKGTVGLTFGRFNELSQRDGFIVAYPNAIDKNWNDGRKLENARAWKEDVNDVGFIMAIIDKLKTDYSIDKNRIFTTGMSNGGFMSSRLACDKADVFRGAAILTATLSKDYIPQCNPKRPLAILIMNGTKDKLVPYNGGDIMVLGKSRGKIISTNGYVDFWKNKNGCTKKKPTVNLEDTHNDGTTITVEEYSNCKNRGALVLYKINGGGHTWPGGKQYLGKWIIGRTNKDINACDVIWNFFTSL